MNITKKKILIIEDNDNIRENLEELLFLEKYEVITASNGLAGTEKALLERPDFILCDVLMPEVNGFEVYQRLKTNLKKNGVPFIFLTANAQEKEIAEGKKLGVAGYITKPFDVDQLLEMINSRLRTAGISVNNE